MASEKRQVSSGWGRGQLEPGVARGKVAAADDTNSGSRAGDESVGRDAAASPAGFTLSSAVQLGKSSGLDSPVIFMGMISTFESLFAEAASRLSGELGPVTSMSDIFPFDFTDYYNAEMGSGLLRVFLTFGGAVAEGDLRRLKSVTSACERELFYPQSERRRVNLDPGILTVDHLVLATHKRAGHRICLGGGVYAELELIYMNGAYRPLPWTYPDYRCEIAARFLESARAALTRGASLRAPGP